MEMSRRTSNARRVACGAVALLLFVAIDSESVHATLLLTPGDTILAIDLEDDSNSGGTEGPENAIDGTLAKYLNRGSSHDSDFTHPAWGANTGFIITPTVGTGVGEAGTIVTSFEITTANDAEVRDPASWSLYGTNDAILSLNNSDGNGGEAWTLIDSGSLSLPSARDTLGGSVAVANTDAYSSYRMIFPTLKIGTGNVARMQIAEIQFDGTVAAIPEPSSMVILLSLSGLALLRRKR